MYLSLDLLNFCFHFYSFHVFVVSYLLCSSVFFFKFCQICESLKCIPLFFIFYFEINLHHVWSLIRHWMLTCAMEVVKIYLLRKWNLYKCSNMPFLLLPVSLSQYVNTNLFSVCCKFIFFFFRVILFCKTKQNSLKKEN